MYHAPLPRHGQDAPAGVRAGIERSRLARRPARGHNGMIDPKRGNMGTIVPLASVVPAPQAT
jgi:hypothetical protein